MHHQSNNKTTTTHLSSILNLAYNNSNAGKLEQCHQHQQEQQEQQ
jgi:hypothetical protein